MKKTIVIDEEIHRKLDILRAEKQFRSFEDAVKFLLDNYIEKEESIVIPA